jgi:hypothetical protein
MLMKNSQYIIENQTHDHPACRWVPQPTALPRAPETVRDDGNDYNDNDCHFLSPVNYAVIRGFLNVQANVSLYCDIFCVTAYSFAGSY